MRNLINDLLNENIHIKNNCFNLIFKDTIGHIAMPSMIQGGKYIQFGIASTLGKYSWIGAFDSYELQQFKPSILIGDYVNIGNFACITSIDKVHIGDGCLISEQVYISDHSHGLDPSNNIPLVNQPLISKGNVLIGKKCFLGFRVSILPGVELGEGCVVGSHSVVNKSFPPYSMIAGIPAVIIKKYSFDKKEWIKIEVINV